MEKTMMTVQEMEYASLMATQNEMIKLGRIREMEFQKIKSNNLLYDKLSEPITNININNNDICDFQEEFLNGNFEDYIYKLSKQFDNELYKLNLTSGVSKKSFVKLLLLRKIDKMELYKLQLENNKLKEEIEEKNISIKEDTEEYEELENEKNKEIQEKDERILKLRNKCIDKNKTIKNIKIYFAVITVLLVLLQYFSNSYGIKFVLLNIFNIFNFLIKKFFTAIKFMTSDVLVGLLKSIYKNFYFITLVLAISCILPQLIFVFIGAIINRK